MSPLPARPLITWYGDDFTGSTDALEVLALGGLKAVLFLEKASPEVVSALGSAQAIGLAGISRSQSPEWMCGNLPELFEWLRSFGGRICHYKVCSTFDSSPEIGSIGRAIEIGRSVFGNRLVPVIAGAPALRRYTAFGNLFAAFGEEVYRIDRHPTMSCHPVTPMREADLRMHLARQTGLEIGLVSLPEMLAGHAARMLREFERTGCGAALMDVFEHASLLEAGRAIWPAEDEPQRFVAGSSGVEACLVAWWHSQRMIPAAATSPSPAEAERIVVLSGSCAPATSRQIQFARQAGFEAIRIDPVRIISSGIEAQEVARAAAGALARGKSTVLYTALDSDGERPVPIDGEARIRFSEDLGNCCGRLLRSVVTQSGVRRVVIAGGDTSSHAGRQLSVHALTFMAPLATGAPLCRAHSADPKMDGLEIVFKGGQIGDEKFFEFVRRGAA